jgi:hypothetical protein
MEPTRPVVPAIMPAAARGSFEAFGGLREGHCEAKGKQT